MNRLRHIFLLLFISSVQFFVTGQDKNEIIQSRIEFISEQLESENIDLTDVVAQLNFYFDHPMNLNSVDQSILQELNLLTDVQINDLLLHRELFGNFISIYELQSLKYWDLETIRLVLPFVKVDDKLDQLHVGLKDMLKYGNFESFFRFQGNIERKEGYTDVSDSIQQNSNSYYYGNSHRYYSRLRFTYRTNLSVGVTAEKDPGEEFFKGSQKNGFDFYSAHAFYKGGKYLKSIALGDYQVQIGQGLNLWSGYAFAKSADVANVKKSANSLKPYTSVDETRFLRGAAVEVGYGPWSLTTFGSYKGIDGSVIADSLVEEQEFVTSINITGFHRTNSELARKNSLKEIIAGSSARYDKRNFSFGLAGVYQGYSEPFNKDTLPYNQFDFRGQSTVGLSGDYSLVVKNLNFFGETAYLTSSKSFATLNGVLIALDQRASLAIVYRNYHRAYANFYSAGFSEGSQTQNEQGIYAGLRTTLSKSVTVNSYVDLFKFPWLKYQVDAPSSGYELMSQISYKPSRGFEIYGRFRQQIREKNSRLSDGTITELEQVDQRNYRVNLSYKISESFTLKSRVEYMTIQRPSSEDESGFVLTQDILFNPKNLPFDLSLRYALFDTDSYDSRIYTYENNALYVFSVPSYYYQGSRAYLLVRYTFFRRIDLWVRYGVSIFANRNSLGSGAEEIIGNTKTDLTVQLRIKL